jgi:hypothetical protein
VNRSVVFFECLNLKINSFRSIACSWALLLFVLLTHGNLNAQNGKPYEDLHCKLMYDHELKMEVYNLVDSAARPQDEEAFHRLMISEAFYFRGVKKKYFSKKMIRIAYMVESNGSVSFLKVLNLKGDTDIETEARRIISLFPEYLPCRCNMVAVPCYGILNLPLYQKKR